VYALHIVYPFIYVCMNIFCVSRYTSRYSVLHCVAAVCCSSVLQCVAVCCSVLQRLDTQNVHACIYLHVLRCVFSSRAPLLWCVLFDGVCVRICVHERVCVFVCTCMCIFFLYIDKHILCIHRFCIFILGVHILWIYIFCVIWTHMFCAILIWGGYGQ